MNGLVAQVQAVIAELGGVEAAAADLGVRPSTLTKVLQGRALSPPASEKLSHRLTTRDQGGKPDWPRESLVKRLQAVYRLYQSLGTLQAVGERLGVTRERVRQLLKQGTGLGLFEYRGREYPFVSRLDVLRAYSKGGNVDRAAKICGVSSGYYKSLLTAYGVGKEDAARIRDNRRRRRCISVYQQIAERLGHAPTTTELQVTRVGHSLHARINRLWGSIDAFRAELNIPTPPKGNPLFRENVAVWMEEQRRMAVIRRLQHLDDVRRCLANGPMTLRAIADECGLKHSRVTVLVGLMRRARELRQLGQGKQTLYTLTHRGFE